MDGVQQILMVTLIRYFVHIYPCMVLCSNAQPYTLNTWLWICVFVDCIAVYACMCAESCVLGHMSLSVFLYTNTFVTAGVSPALHTCLCIYKCVFLYVCVSTLSWWIYQYVCFFVYVMGVCSCVPLFASKCMCGCVCMCLCVRQIVLCLCVATQVRTICFLPCGRTYQSHPSIISLHYVFMSFCVCRAVIGSKWTTDGIISQ